MKLSKGVELEVNNKLTKTCICGISHMRDEFEVVKGFKQKKCDCGVTVIDCTDMIIHDWADVKSAAIFVSMWALFWIVGIFWC